MDKTYQTLIMRDVRLLRPELMFTPLLHFSEAQQCTLGIGGEKKTLIWIFIWRRLNSFTYMKPNTIFLLVRLQCSQ